MKTTKFKPSEVGPIPVEWEVCELGSLWENFRTGPFGSSLHAQDYVTGGTPLVNPMHIQDGKIMPTLDMTVDKATERRLSAYRLSKDDIIIGRRGEMGRAALVGEKETGWLCGTGCFFLRMKDRVCPDYVVRYLRTQACVSVLEGGAVGTTLVNLNQTILGRVNIPVPPRPEQEKIAEVLSDVDALLAAMTTLIEKKRAIKQGAMQQLLGMRNDELGIRNEPIRRLAGFSGAWVEKRFDECFELISNNTYSREFMCHDVTGIANIHYGDVLIKYGSVLDFSKEQVDSLTSSLLIKSEILKDGDLIIADTAEDETVGKAVEVQHLGTRHAVAGLHTIACRPLMEFAPRYLGYYINSSAFHNQLLPLITGTKVSSISKAGLRTTVLTIPPSLAEQKAIAAVLSDMDAEIAALEAKRAKYESIKQGMMQELLTGWVRLVGWPDGAGLRNTGD